MRIFHNKGFNPVVLNMANQNTPGGGYKSGAGAQEENLHRRTNLFQYLEDPEEIQGHAGGIFNYPIPNSGAIYSSNVIVIRNSEAEGYGFYKVPRKISVVTCPAVKAPRLLADGKMAEEPTEIMKAKIRTMLSVGTVNGHDAIVLSAFGCGAYRCPALHVAQLFKDIIESEFSTAYKHISFSIIEDHNSKKVNELGNVAQFVSVFGQNNYVEGSLVMEEFQPVLPAPATIQWFFQAGQQWQAFLPQENNTIEALFSNPVVISGPVNGSCYLNKDKTVNINNVICPVQRIESEKAWSDAQIVFKCEELNSVLN